MTTYRDLVTAFRKLQIDPDLPVIAHASLSAFGSVPGGAGTLVGALLSTFQTLIMPTFTYKTMIIPEEGPADNAIVYGSGKDSNRMAEFFRPEMPADRLMGAVAEALRRHPNARRSSHPILSFSGVNAARALESQTLKEPLAPIRVLSEDRGWVLLLGVGHTVNTSLHFVERLSGRKSFVRWALTLRGVVECPGFPGCSDGFEAITPRLEGTARKTLAGPASITAIPLQDLIETGRDMISEDPLALLCPKDHCERCNAVRAEITATQN